MSKGKAKVFYEHSAGSVGVSDAPIWDFLYRTSTVRDEKYNIGDRVVLPDGRVFRYAKATNIVTSTKYGLKFWNRIADGIGALLAQGQAVGDTSIKIAAAGVTEDEFRGGYIIIHVGTIPQYRGVIGNTVTDSAGNIIVYLDASLTTAVTVANWTEILQSPYSSVHFGGTVGDDYSSVAGIPTVITAAANQYVWVQTWGPIWINPHGASLTGAGTLGGEHKLVFDFEGSVCIEDDVNHGGAADTDEHQLAGFIIDRRAAVTEGPPLVMLSISP